MKSKDYKEKKKAKKVSPKGVPTALPKGIKLAMFRGKL
jgi:hypothetical protein